MKKIFAFAAAFAAALSVNATVVNLDHSALNTDAATDVAAGTVLATANEFTVTTVFDDQMKAVNIKHEDYIDVKLNGVACNIDTLGVQGANNPKDADGGNPANTLNVPAGGSFLKVTAAADGYLYVFHKASSNKQYVVFEEDIPVGYDFGMITTNAEGVATPLTYTIAGDNEYNQLASGRSIGFVEVITGVAANNGDYKKNGLSAIRVACYTGLEYKIVATGSKISATAVAYTATAEEVKVVNADGNEIVVLPAAAAGIQNNAAAVKASKVIENGQVVIIKNGVRYNTLGAQL